jgi:large subunit ribosomal protein L23
VNVHDVIRRPLVTEKSTVGRETANLVTLAVDPRASKHDIQRAVESLFDVKVLSVRTMRQPPKQKRSPNRRHQGRKPEWKKALVQLAEGQSIEFFEGM